MVFTSNSEKMKKVNQIIRLLIVLTTMGMGQEARATHVMGADITYRTIGSLKYELALEVYRDCRGVPLSPLKSVVRNQSGTISFPITWHAVSVEDITPVCNSGVLPCNPLNTRTAKGIEKHVFRDTLDLNTGQLDTFVSLGTMIVEAQQCCRNGAITTGAANINFYTFAEIAIDKNASNQSIVFYEIPFSIIETNKPFRRNYGGYDVDGDSLVFEMVDPLRVAGAKAEYNSKFSPLRPFTVYEPAGKPSPDPEANPPIGYYLDPNTGSLSFTPTKPGEVTVVAMEVREYRNGQMITRTRREMQFWVENTPFVNKFHTIAMPAEICVTEGDTVNFEVVTSDSLDTIPDQDSVFVRWDNPIVGATFDVTKAKWEKGKFQWVIKKSDVRDQPYALTFSAIDNSCPLRITTQRTIVIRTIPKPPAPDIDFGFDTDGDTSVFTNLSGSKDSIVSVTWSIGGSVVNSKHDFDTLLATDKTYAVKLVVEHRFSQCGQVFYFTDSVVKQVTPKSCEARYVIALDTNQTSSFRVYLINVSRGMDSARWYFSDGDSLNGTGVHRFKKFGKYEVCLKVWNKSCVSTFCDSVGMDSMGNLYKAEGFTVVLTDDENLGVPRLEPARVDIFPVPFGDRITVALSNGNGIRRVQVRNTLGQLEADLKVDKRNKVSLNTNHLLPGIYLVSIQTDEGVITRKVIKQ